MSGPAGTGKSLSSFLRLHLILNQYPGARALAVRQTAKALRESGLVTYQQKILHPSDGVTSYGGSAFRPASFTYPNSAQLIAGGLDDISKVMSTDYDIIFVQEAKDITESNWEDLTTRLRNGRVPYQLIFGDTNPSAPTHWIKRRAQDGKLNLLQSKHEDNPYLHDGQTWTQPGTVYLERLDALSGVRYKRLRLGLWVAAEGQVYEDWNPTVHIVKPFRIHKDWPRFRVVDFGFANPFLCQWWAIDPDGRAYLYREIYRTQTIVEDHAREIHRLSKGEHYVATIADHDAEDRATLHKCAIKTIPAKKKISPGIQAVQDRLRPAGDGKPRLFLFEDALTSRDLSLKEAGKPTCTAEEFESYVWPQSVEGKLVKEQPVGIDDHGMDCVRYMMSHLDSRRVSVAAHSISRLSPWRI